MVALAQLENQYINGALNTEEYLNNPVQSRKDLAPKLTEILIYAR
jgi:hypothetical protein